jgi:hypothetical protein
MLTKSDHELNLARIHEWIRAVDQKVSIFLAFQGITLSIIFSNTFFWIKNNFEKFSELNLLMIFIAVFVTGYSIYKSTTAIFPRLTKNASPKSIIYFNDIANYDLGDFKKAVNKMGAEDYENELIEQAHECSIVAQKKHFQFRDAIISFFVGILILAINYIVFQNI